MTADAERKPRLVSVHERIVDKLERNAGIVAAAALLLIFVIALGQSATKLLWYDELVTVKTASLPHWVDVWNFYAQGLDTTGPLQSLIARVGLMLPIGAELGSRLPFTLAYLVTCVCVFRFVRRRYPAGYALAALFYSLNSTVFYYAIEARAYALVLAGASVAMVSWQSAVSGRHRTWSLICLWLGLAFAVDAHSFAVFLFAPFALAQVILDMKHKKPDWGVWTALMMYPAGLLPVLHGQLLANKRFGASFWSQPHLRSIFRSYWDFVTGGMSYFILLFLVAIGAALLQRQRLLRFTNEIGARGFSRAEWVLVAMFALLPFYVVPASFTLHIYNPRYVICCNIGLIILAIAAVAEASRRSRLAGAALFASFLFVSTLNCAGNVFAGLYALAHPGLVHEQLQASYDNLQWVKLVEESKLPVATDLLVLSSQLDFYASPDLQHRIIGVTDITDRKDYSQFQGAELNFLRFSKLFSYPVSDVSHFLPEHSHFLLVEDQVKYVWLPHYLIEQQQAGNASFTCIGPDCGGSGTNVYDVQFRRLPAPPENEPNEDSIATH